MITTSSWFGLNFKAHYFELDSRGNISGRHPDSTHVTIHKRGHPQFVLATECHTISIILLLWQYLVTVSTPSVPEKKSSPSLYLFLLLCGLFYVNRLLFSSTLTLYCNLVSTLIRLRTCRQNSITGKDRILSSTKHYSLQRINSNLSNKSFQVFTQVCLDFHVCHPLFLLAQTISIYTYSPLPVDLTDHLHFNLPT
jgi:hypothetical protein